MGPQSTACLCVGTAVLDMNVFSRAAVWRCAHVACKPWQASSWNLAFFPSATPPVESRVLSAHQPAMAGKVPVRYLYRHVNRGWYCPLVPLGKTFPTATDALKALRATAKGQALVAKHGKKPGAARPCSTAGLVNRVRCLSKYTFKGARRWFPADVHAREQHARTKLGRQMFRSDPALHFLSLQLRMTPWKEALTNSWARRARKSESRINLIRRCLEDCAVAIAKQPVSAAWQANAVHNQLRCAGPVSRLDLARLRDHVLLF